MLAKLSKHVFVKALFLICALSLYLGHFFPIDQSGDDGYLDQIFPGWRMDSFGSDWVQSCMSAIPLDPKQAGIVMIMLILGFMVLGAYMLSIIIPKLPNNSKPPEIRYESFNRPAEKIEDI